MDPNLYAAAMEGKFDVLIQKYDAIQLEGQLTPNKNTILHVAAQFGQVGFVEAILEQCPILLHRKNSKGETALHIAAREGYSEIVKALIERAKERDIESGSSSGGVRDKEMLLRAINDEDRDTALHMAVRNCHVEVVRLLTKDEDREFKHPANRAEETPLYLAAEGINSESRDYKDAVFVILDNCASPANSGPGGRTALHAAAQSDRQGRIIDRLLHWEKDLIKEPDAHGWTPLHFAARNCNVEGVKRLLNGEKSGAYNTADEGKTALHIAAALGYTDVMSEILSHCPDCWEVVNSQGQNVLHIALEMKNTNSVKFIWEKLWSRHLISQKDHKGNTPLHMIAKFDPEDYFEFIQIIKKANWRSPLLGRDAPLFTEVRISTLISNDIFLMASSAP